jgi:membrane-associated protease RseP (regulator of RpoE activity)
MKKAFVLLPLLLFLGGCGNPCSTFYTDFTGGKSVLENPDVIIPTGEPKLIQGSNIEKDIKRMLEDGYLFLGKSEFEEGESYQYAYQYILQHRDSVNVWGKKYITSHDAFIHAKKIHADTVIVYSQYAHTVSGSMPMTVPNMQTSYDSGTIYGSGGGFANYSGSSTTYGSTTTYIPYQIRRYDYLATYWVKIKPPRLGIYFEDLTDELRKKIESNKGVYITVVIKDSPAFNADLLSGDVIRKLNDTEVIDRTHFGKLLAENKGQQITLEIFRNDKTIIKQLQLN